MDKLQVYNWYIGDSILNDNNMIKMFHLIMLQNIDTKELYR